MKIASKIKPVNNAKFKIADAEDIAIDNTDVKSKFNKVDNKLNENINRLNSEINVKFSPTLFNCKGDGVTDDTDAIISSINFIKKQYSDNNYNGKICVINFPEGEYRITKQIKIPLYIHLKAIGNVTILSEVENDSCLWFYPDEDPAVGGYEDDWFRGKTVGNLIDGSSGGFFIRNNLPSIYYKGETIGDPKGAIGVEIGSREETKPWRLQSFLTLKNIRIELFNIGLKLNSYHFYINKFDKILLSNNNINLQLGQEDKDPVDSGENIVFDFCTFANSKVAVLICRGGYGATFNNCSIDYNIAGIINEKITGSDIYINNCNIEGCHSEEYNKSLEKPKIPYKNYYGIYKNIGSDGFYSSSINFSNTKLVLTRGTGRMIDGVVNRTFSSFNKVDILTPMELKNKFHDDKWMFLTTDNVNVLTNNIQYVDRRLGPFISKDYALTLYPNFKDNENEVITNGKKFNKSSMEFWENKNIKSYQIIDDGGLNKKVLVLEGEVGSKSIKIQPTGVIPVLPGENIIMQLSVKCEGTCTLNTVLQYCNEKGDIIGFSNENITNINCNSNWDCNAERLLLKVRNGVNYIKPVWKISNNSSIKNIYITDLYVYKI